MRLSPPRPLISTGLQPGVCERVDGSRFNGFRFWPTHWKPLKRFRAAVLGHTRLKPGANERGIGGLGMGLREWSGLSIVHEMRATQKRRPRGHPSSEPRAEFDFSQGVRGKYSRRYQSGSNVVVLKPDVAKAFPSPERVNRSLRALANLVELQAK